MNSELSVFVEIIDVNERQDVPFVSYVSYLIKILRERNEVIDASSISCARQRHMENHSRTRTRTHEHSYTHLGSTSDCVVYESMTALVDWKNILMTIKLIRLMWARIQCIHYTHIQMRTN